MTTVKNTEVLYQNYNSVAPLGLICMNGTQELGAKINSYLEKWADRNNMPHDDYMIEGQCPRFQSGDAKGLIKSTVRGKDLFILVDVGNYSVKYKLFDQINSMSPDDHYMDLMRIIQAASGKPHRINVIMPLLYGGRQHRRSYRESLDCAVALQELQRMGVSNLVTVDAHDPRVCNSVPLMGFDNVIPSYQVLKAMFADFPDLIIDKNHFMVVSPVEDKDVFVADDIISSGESMLDIAKELKIRKAKRMFAYATYPIFTNGLAKFDEAYEKGLIHGVFGTNLTYRTPELLSRPWFYEVDVSKYLAYFITSINHDTSISNVIDPHEKIKALLKEHRGQ